MTVIMHTKTHEIGSHLSERTHAFEISFREIPCNCGAARGRYHTVHESNPTGHSVGCPVFLRWIAADSAVAFAEALRTIYLHAGTVGIIQDEHSTKPTAEEVLAQIEQCAKKVLEEQAQWLEP